MDASSFTGELSDESSSLSPLPPDLRSGLTAVAVFASISLLASTALFVHLTIKLVHWTIQTRSRGQNDEDLGIPDLSLGLAERHFGVSQLGVNDGHDGGRPRKQPNQFTILLYNLLLADMHQSLSFFLNAIWVDGGLFTQAPWPYEK